MNKSTSVAIVGSFIVITAIILNLSHDDPDERKEDQQRPAVKKTETVGLSKKSGELVLKEPSLEKPKYSRPTFDIVRINPKGDTVIAGRATPGTKVIIFDIEKKIGEVKTDKRGEWVFLPSSPLPPGNRQLSLKMITGTGDEILSANDVMLFIPEKGKDIAGRTTQKSTQPLALKVPATQPLTSKLPTTQPLALRIPTKDESSIEVLQKTTIASPTSHEIRFIVDVVDYNQFGKLFISGKAPKRALIQLYVNNEFLGRTTTDERGVWGLSPRTTVKPGVYTLRADHIDINGKVLARREVVFARSVPLTDVKPGSLVVVEPGNSLWRIARRTYGSGFKFTIIYEANKIQIRDADLIFPGQVFALPSSK